MHVGRSSIISSRWAAGTCEEGRCKAGIFILNQCLSKIWTIPECTCTEGPCGANSQHLCLCLSQVVSEKELRMRCVTSNCKQVGPYSAHMPFILRRKLKFSLQRDPQNEEATRSAELQQVIWSLCDLHCKFTFPFDLCLCFCGECVASIVGLKTKL